ncbi:MAG: penicillin-binding transpeptidase domain-containing protein [Candidatus Latescibacterota bacterium]|nr:penicillin-binding transpeptidase domain-containing protein [Candidatus Latescibacterota bacterium]
MTKKNGIAIEWSGPKRLGIATVFGLFFWIFLFARLVHVQVILGPSYAQKARKQYAREVKLEARRGSIYDRRGTELATDLTVRSYVATPKHIKDPERVLDVFGGLGYDDSGRIEHLINGDRKFVYLARWIDDEKLFDSVSDLNGIDVLDEIRRYYPLGSLAGQLLGHTSIDNEGREGIERAFDGELRDFDGKEISFVYGKSKEPIPGLSEATTPAQDGRDIFLTIDAFFQGILEEELKRTVEDVNATSAMGIVMDPNTGAVLAMANAPDFDPNQVAKSTATMRRNRVVMDAYEPGSTFKVIVASAVLEDGLVNVNDMVNCGLGELHLPNGDVIRDIEQHGDLTFAEVLQKSSNIGLIKFARLLPRERFYQHMRRFGFASRTGIGLPAENSGLLRNVEDWSERSLETMAIGQEVSVTVLQLAQAYCAIANGGELIAPRIVRNNREANDKGRDDLKPTVIRRVMRSETAIKLRNLLQGVVDNGTGKLAQIPGLNVGGKTGTAQKALEDGSGYDEEAAIVSFAGFLPVAAPRYVCVIVVDEPKNGGGGGSVAAPVFQRTMQRIVHLPGEILASREQYFFDEHENLLSAPQLKGMTKQAARVMTKLRGCRLILHGEGDFVVSQDPAPGIEMLPGADVHVSMGSLMHKVIDVEEKSIASVLPEMHRRFAMGLHP